VAAVLFTVSALASNHIWTGAASSQTSDPANWSGGSPAGDSAADLVFPPAAAQLHVVNDIADLRIASLALLDKGYVIGGNAITLLGGTISDATLGPNTIAADIVISGAVFFRTDGTTDLFNSAGLTFSGSIRGSGRVIKIGPGRVIFAGSAPNTYEGTTNIRNGELQLAKSNGVNAVPGDVFLEWAAASEKGNMRTVTNEQIPDSATIWASITCALAFGGVETVGPLVLQNGVRVGTNAGYDELSPDTGTLILGGDVTMLAHPANRNLEATIFGNVVLPATRTINGSSFPVFLTRVSGNGGLTFRSTTTAGRVSISGTYSGPTLVDGARVSIDNPATDATLRRGILEGSVKSILVESGTTFNARLAKTSLVSAGPVTLDGAKLDVDFDAPRQLGKTHVLLLNDSADPVNGTFRGLPEGASVGDTLRVSYTGGDGNDVTLTQVGKYATRVTVTPSKGRIAFDEALTVTARVFDDQADAIPTGTVTFSTGTTILATVPLSGASAAIITELPAGLPIIKATYSGDAIFAPSFATTSVAVTPPKSVITSIEPDVVDGAAHATLTIRGTGFVPIGTVFITPPINATTRFISSSELEVTMDVPDVEGVQVRSVQVRQETMASNSVLLKIVSTLPPSELLFDAQSISAPVTPAASSVWFFVARRTLNFKVESDAVMTTDSEITGLARLQYRALQTTGIYTMFDVATGMVRAGAPTGSRRRESVFPPNVFLRDASGRFSHVVMPAGALGNYLLLRPGVGAWKAISFIDGSADDRDGTVNKLLFFDLNAMTPVGDSPAPPAGLEDGDVFVAIGPKGEWWFADRVDDHLRAAAHESVVSFATTVPARSGEKDGLARVMLIRTGSADGAASVRYATADDSAQAGIHYQAVSGSATFAPGETIKSITVPLLDDAVYSGVETGFKVILADPSGTALGDPAPYTVRIRDDDPPPVVSFENVTVPEGDAPGQHASLGMTLTGATRVPARLTWYWTVAGTITYYIEGPIVFQPGQTHLTVDVPFNGNSTPNRDVTIEVGAFAMDNVTIASGRGKITIVDDD